MRMHRRPHHGQRLLVKALSSSMSTGSKFLTRLKKSYRKRTALRNSFLAMKSATVPAIRSFRLVTRKRRQDDVISQDRGEKSPTYIVGDTGSTSSIAKSGANPAHPEGAGDTHERLPEERPRDSLKRKASTTEDIQSKMLPPAKRAATENFSDLCREGSPDRETPPVETRSMEIPPMETPPMETPTMEIPPVEIPPVHIPPMETPPVHIPPVEIPPVEMPGFWSHGDNLSPEHLSILRSTGEAGMLDDDIIGMAQELLQHQFEGFDGLQSPAVLLVPGYCVLQNAVQIHYDEERVHWLTTCFKDGQILVADSIKTRKLSPSIRQQIINMYGVVVDEPLKHLSFLNVDQQKNYYDCGVFATAFAYEFLAEGGDPTARFQHQEIRAHLLSCLKNGRITAFPKKVRK
ncbi:uncharacterized protein ACNLHF_011994 isoform 1-T2 [Anomaloglossus baeobatrachus]|uniref:uncharacterized protein LOC142294886 n=1 Tax=Anomaloglossus baeobatrachus TaxID=238106 RepID=UPI003F4FFFBA